MLKRNLNFIHEVLPSVNIFFRKFWASLGNICHMVCCMTSFYPFSRFTRYTYTCTHTHTHTHTHTCAHARAHACALCIHDDYTVICNKLLLVICKLHEVLIIVCIFGALVLPLLLLRCLFSPSVIASFFL